MIKTAKDRTWTARVGPKPCRSGSTSCGLRRMPVSAARFASGGRPPFGLGIPAGSTGSTIAYRSSGKSCLIMPQHISGSTPSFVGDSYCCVFLPGEEEVSVCQLDEFTGNYRRVVIRDCEGGGGERISRIVNARLNSPVVRLPDSLTPERENLV